MVASVAALALFVAVAQVEDHHMYQPAEPEMVGYPNWVVTPVGRDRLYAALQAQAETIAQKETEAEKLRAGVVELAAKPELTWQGGAALVGIGLVVGVASVLLVGAIRSAGKR